MFRSMLPVDDIAKRIANLSPEKRALLELQLQKRKGLKEPIAIIGIGCRFPGASSPNSFWQLLKNGVDAITEVPPDRWDLERFYNADPTAPGKMYCRYGGFLGHVDQFDPEFFGIAPREATYIDPQQRLLLEVIWEALEDAGQVPSQLSGSQTGVFVGISTHDYGQLLLQSPEVVDTYTNTGVASTMAANRISYLLNLKGPSLTVDTACSSSLVAVHLACQSIWNGESTVALAGGVNLMLTPVVTVGLSKLTALSPDGRCKAFDSRANGFVRGEGAGVIVVKPLSKALIDKDPIYAVIRGSAVNQDGRTNGLTAPNRDAQEAVLVSAYQNAGISPSDVQYVETHGTGTLLGDPIEAMALGNVLKRDSEAVPKEHRYDNNSDNNSDNYGALSTHPTNKPVAIGSVKSNIGHLEAAAGIASLIKVALSLKHQELLPSLHFLEPNPHIPFDQLSLRVQQQGEPWLWDVIPPFAGVSSFGFGGTNAHVVLQGAPDLTKAISNDINQNDQDQNYHLFTLSAKTATALQTLGKRYIDFIGSEPSSTLADICLTSNKGRSHFNYRLALLVKSTDQLQQQLTKLTESETISEKIAQNSPTPPEIVFLFTGQGSQYSGMGRQLYETQPIFRATLDQCAEILQSYLEQPLLDVLYPEILSDNSDNSTLLNQTAYTQPALFALEYSLAQLWRSWGIEPTLVMGHSVGEYVAATVAGVFSLEDGLKLIAERARLMQQLPEGGEMAVVLTNEQQVTEAIQSLSDKVSIAAINGPENIVISGESQAVQTVITRLRSQKVKSLKLPVSHAFHSALMEPMVADFAQVLSEISLHPPQIEIISNVTGQLATAEIATTEYWCDHVRGSVKFYQSMETLYQEGYHLCVEVGPKPSLLGMGKACLPKGKLTAIPSLRPGKPDSRQMLESLASLYKHGASVDWVRFYQHNPHRLVSLPTYPFERQRYWLDTTSVKQLSPISYGQLSTPSYGDWLYQIAWRPKDVDSSDVYTDISRSSTNWLIFADKGGFGETFGETLVQQQLEAKPDRILLISPGSSYEQLQPNHYQINPAQPQHFQRLLAQEVESLNATSVIVVHMWSLDTPALDRLQTFPLDATLENGCGSVLHLLQALVKAELAQPPRLWLVTEGTQPVALEKKGKTKKSLQIAQSPLWGLGAVIAQEHPELWAGIIDLESREGNEQHYQEQSLMLLNQILRPEGENQIALRGGQAYVPRLIHQQQQSQPPALPLQLKPDSTYLITGGLGSLGLKVAEWMVDKGARYLVLVGRSQPNSRASEIIGKLEEQGVMVVLEQVDVSQEPQVRDCLNRIQVSLPPLKGIIHGAGVLEDGVLLHQDWAKFAKVMKPKVEGAWNLHRLTQEMALDLFVLFSSATSILGTPGQGNYSAANGFLDSLSHYRQGQGARALSINWGPWAEMGLAASVGKRMAMLGIEPIQAPQGLQILEQLLAQDGAQVGVLPVEWSKLKERLPVELPLFLSEVITTETLPPQEDGENDNSGIFAQLLASTTTQREELLKDYLKQQIAKALGISREISGSSNLMDLGADSLMIVEVLNACKKDLKITLYPREFYERPTIKALAEYLALEIERLHQPQPTQTSLTTTSLSDIKNWANPWAWNNNSERKFTKPTQRNRSMVFLLCSPRSGSTLLRVMLAGHRDLFCPPELHLLPFDTMAERNQSLGSTHLGEGLARAFMEIMNLDAQASTTLVEEITQQDWSIQKVYGRLQELTGQRMLVDKSPTYAGSLGTLRHGEDLFEQAKYIHLVRHPYAVIDSFVKNRMDKIFGIDEVDPYWLAEEVWTTCNRNILDFFEEISPSNHHLVYYEELVKEPAKVMARLCEFLGIPFDQAVLEPYQGQRMTDGVHPQSLPVDDPNFRNHNQIDSALGEVWRQIQLPRALGKFAEEVATRLDYQLPLQVEPSAQPANLGQKATLREELEPIQESYLDVRGLELCLCSWGPADGELILCIHGVLEHGAAWEEIAEPLARMGYRVVAPDQRGHGRSQHVGMGGSYQLIDYLGDLDAIASAAPNAIASAAPNAIANALTDQPFILVGHSMGAVVAATFASVRPEKVKSLVLLEPVLPGEQKDDQTAQQIATHLDYLASPPQHQVFGNIQAAANRLRRLTPNLSEELALKHAERITEPCQGGVCWRWDPRLQVRTGIGLSGTAFNRDKYTQLLSQIKAPTTLVYGNNSNFNRAEDLALQQAAIPHAQTVTLSGGHNLHVDAPDAIVAIIANQKLNLKN